VDMPGQVLIYGGTGGIGAATARLLRIRGHSLHLVARNESRLAALAEELGAGFTAGDVTSADVFTRATQAAPDDSRIAGLVYAVGTINLKPLGRLTEADFEQDFRVNALGAAKAVQAALPALKAGDEPSSVVLFSTVAVAQGFASHASISMAKGAVEGLTLALAAELAPKVRVNAIAPSLTRTRLAHGLISNETVANGIAQMHALPRLGTAEDIAALAAFLVSEASWITGQIIGVDGGRSTLRPKG
jgi:NAD(P)-dependent dehydrogenase (short-subunit alcohol dehydrogenase family)